MRKVIGILSFFVIYFLVLLYIQVSYNLDDYANLIFGFFFKIFGTLYGVDLIREFVLFGLIATGFYGTFALSKSEENKIWSIISLIMSVVSFLALVKG